MRQRIFRSLLLVTTVAVVLTAVLFSWLSYQYINKETFASLKRQANVLIMSEPDGTVNVTKLGMQQISDRMTIIAPDGQAIFDNYTDATTMENHLQREEVREAIVAGEGRAKRSSETLGKDILYYAVLLPDGNVLRLARTSEVIFQQAEAFFEYLLLVLVLVLGVTYVWAKAVTGRVLKPLVNLDLNAVEADDVYPELQPIVESFAAQREQLGREMRRYKNKKQELKAVTNNMDEGLLFLTEGWEIDTINKSAVKFFGCDKQDLIGKNFRQIDGSEEIGQLLEEINTKGKGRLIINRGSNYYQLNGSKVSDKGSVLLIMDVTERTASEKLRREFSANVSHELKTPLQSVLGYSEIMLNGLVRPEDSPRFLQKIYDEAKNLLQLIDDIIKLSKLDELNHDMLEEFTLQGIAGQVFERLKDKAAKNGVQLQLSDATGGACSILGIPSLMEEVFFNLMDNAIKYNHTGGSVTVSLCEKENKYVVKISDTGFGIAQEELSHIFERFYRVDRSRHKAIDGTGLGLSIVKHGVMFHGGTIRVTSELGKGTDFIIKLPKPAKNITNDEDEA